MGLDSYVFRIKKAKNLEPRVYTPAELQQLDLDYFLKDEPDRDLVRELLPYCQVVQVKAPWINFPKIQEAYGLSDEAYICMQRGNGDIGVTDPQAEKRDITLITNAEIEEKYLFERTLPYCVYHSEKVAYWRKNRSVQDFFYENLNHVKNTGFYRIDDEVLVNFNIVAREDWGELPVERPNSEQALFYHEWY